MSDDKGFSDLIDRVYEAPLDPGGWASFVPALEEMFKARVGLFVRQPQSVGLLAGCSASTPNQMAQYSKYLWREDRAVSKLRSLPVGDIVVDTELVTPRERLKSPFYNDFLGTMDTERGIYAPFRHRDGDTYYLSAQRSARRGDYEEYEVALLRRLAPHLQRSVRTWERLRQTQVEQNAALQALNHVRTAILLVDRSAKLLFANEKAAAHLQTGALTIQQGKVQGRTRRTDEALRQSIERATRPERPAADTVDVAATGQNGPLSILVAPLPDQAASHGEPLAMLLVDGGESPLVEQIRFSRAYNLTPAEARLLSALVSGERMSEYAQRRGISVTTAKSHLRALFDKTGERRQADLIRRALESRPCT